MLLIVSLFVLFSLLRVCGMTYLIALHVVVAILLFVLTLFYRAGKCICMPTSLLIMLGLRLFGLCYVVSVALLFGD